MAVPMAGGPFLASLLTFGILSLSFVLIPAIPDALTDRGHRNTTTMFLPLFLHNSDRGVAAYHKRQLLNTSHRTARMFLHDDLLLNGYYTSRLWIGSPPQMFALIVDTGSTVTYVPCATCEQCGNHQDPKFQPELSSTYKPVKCNIDCPCDSDRKQCTYERQYAEMSSSSGVLGNDIVSFGNQSELEPQRAVFGCENMETGDLYSQHADGIMGLGRGDLSIMDQLVDKGVIGDSFSLCYGGMDLGGGTMVLGGISSPADMIFTHSDPLRSPYYNIELTEIHVAGKALPLHPKTFDGKHGTVLDSGTTYAYLPEFAFGAFKTAIFRELKSLKRIQGPDPSYNDICFSGAGSDAAQLSKSFPLVEMVFGNGQKLMLSPENYLFRHSKMRGSYCLGIFQNGKDPTTLLGGIVVRNTLVTYDREHERVGFWKTNCSELWERLNISPAPPPLPFGLNQANSSMRPNISPAPPPLPFGLNQANSSMSTSPTLAPTEPPPFKGPGDIKVRLITFSMLLSVKYSDLKPHISELALYIAKELDVNASQVQLMNFTSRDNDTLLRWAIAPAESSDYISNSAAMDIISKLNENHMHLPDSFGNFKLFEWNIEPPQNGTWWQQNYLVVVSFAIIIGIGMLAFGAWFIWRKEQPANPYRPVDSIVAEQELQPLQNS